MNKVNRFLLCTLLIILFSCSALAETVPVTGVTLDKQSATITLGMGMASDMYESIPLIATVEPANATNMRVIWSSDNETIATVMSFGIVIGVSPGIAIITATTQDGGFTAKCEVTVIVNGIFTTSVGVWIPDRD